MSAPIDVQYPLFLKILTFDRQLDQRARKEVVIGIVYQDRVRPSWLAKNEFLSVVENSPIRRIKNMPVRAVPIAINGDTDIHQALKGKHVDVLYIAPLRAYDVRSITRISRSRKMLTLTGVPEYVESGAAIGIGVSGETPQILVNLKAAREEGADLHASLLRLAKLVGGE